MRQLAFCGGEKVLQEEFRRQRPELDVVELVPHDFVGRACQAAQLELPRHVARVKELARAGFYNGHVFHRVIEGFMAQTGDGQRFNGTGGSKYPNLPAEFSNVPFKRGIVGMARASDPNSANSQFFIMFADGSFLNGKYTVVGEVVSGMDVVDKIKRGEPVQDPDKMVKVQVASDIK